MKILVHDYPGNPLHIDLSAALAMRGHYVVHAYSRAYVGPRGKMNGGRQSNFEVVELGDASTANGKLSRRFIEERRYGGFVTSLAREQSPDVVLSSNTPLDAQYQLTRFTRRHDIPHVYWMTDLRSTAVRELSKQRFGPLGWPIAKHYARRERLIVAQSDHVVCLVPGFVPIVEEWGVNAAQISTVLPWGPLDDISVLPRDNSFAREHDLVDRFVVMYAGTLGYKHDPELIAATAQAMSGDRDVVFVVITEGAGALILEQRKKDLSLDNLVLLPFQPFESLPSVLATADVSLSVVKPFASDMCAPSKVWSALCSGRPTLLAAPQDNLAAEVINDAKAGVVVDGNVDELDCALRWLIEHEEARLAMGCQAREYAESHFDVKRIAERFDQILGDAL